MPADQPDRIFMFGALRPDAGEELERKVDKDLPSVLDALDSLGQGASFALGHNVIDHDLPMLKRQPQLTLQQLLLSDLGGASDQRDLHRRKYAPVRLHSWRCGCLLNISFNKRRHISRSAQTKIVSRMNMRLSVVKAVVPAIVLTLGGCGFIEDFGIWMDNPETIETAAFWEDITPGRLDRFLTRHPHSVHRFSGWGVAPIAHAMNTDEPFLYFEVLMKHKVNLNLAVGNDGRTALHWAIAEGKPIEIIDWLLEHGANPNIMSGEYGALSQAAIHTPNPEVLDHLLDYADQRYVCCGRGTLFWRELTPELERLLLAHLDPKRITDSGWRDIATRIFRYASNPETVHIALDFTELLLRNGMSIQDFMTGTNGWGESLTSDTRSDVYLNYLLDQGGTFKADDRMLSLSLNPEYFRAETIERVCNLEREAGLFNPIQTACPYGENRLRMYDGQGW